MSDLHAHDPQSWLDTVWDALHAYREDLIPEGDESYDEQWNDITTAMAWITESVTGEDDKFTLAVAVEAALTSVRVSPVPITGEEALKMLVERLADDSIDLKVEA